jgi:hypothetical protein
MARPPSKAGRWSPAAMGKRDAACVLVGKIPSAAAALRVKAVCNGVVPRSFFDFPPRRRDGGRTNLD